MKKLTLLLAVIAPAFCMAQTPAGIKFNTGAKWADLLAQAKTEHKLIFVDVYTVTCGPCKEMDATVFPLQTVGDAYNGVFINTRMDAEKGEGIDVKKKYQVASYPTYLFVDGDGVLIYRSGDSMPANSFIKQGQVALSEAKESQTIVQQEALYPDHKTDKAFMYGYLAHLTKLRLQTEPMLDNYLVTLNKTEQADPKNIQLIADNGGFSNKKIALGIGVDILKQNQRIFDSLRTVGKIKETIEIIENNAKSVSFNTAVQTKNDKLFRQVQALTGNRKDSPFNNKQTLAINYYFQTGNTVQFKKEAFDYANFLLSIPNDTLKKWDQDIYLFEKADVEKQNNPKYNNPEFISTYLHTQSIQVASKLAALSGQMMELKLTAQELKGAMKWAKAVLAIAETDKNYYRDAYPSFQKNHAVALYKSNQKKAAIAELKESISGMSPDAIHTLAMYNDILLKMQKNQNI